MYLWRRRATLPWFKANEPALQSRAAYGLVAIERPGRRRLLIEAACQSRRQANQLSREFGGDFEKLPRDWLGHYFRRQKSEPLKIGRRLIVTAGGAASISQSRPRRIPPSAARPASRPAVLVIPAGAAFGTGQHATTAMCLRLLEELSRQMKPGWSLVDLGTGSGILALAARRLGAKRVVGLDVDPLAISTAKANARLNKIDGVTFRMANVRCWQGGSASTIVTANLFSALLIEILAKVKRSHLIASGVLRGQEVEVRRALQRYNIRIAKVRRRGKWIALSGKGG